ncbi:MAG: acyl-CoA thioesterase [Elusimicrobia bacterium]|nr:acyl-CoA thioesterase [Elusimicrobiota bacterium]MDE2425249.1 acyl-CoA thioesterase [Elusimicrobiota bacterium]
MTTRERRTIKPVRSSLTTLADLTYPPNANIHGNVFGGHILQMVDKAAAVCGYRHAGAAVVTVAMDRVDFLVPIKVGAFVIVEARINYAGKTSMEIGVEVYAEDLIKGTRRHTNSCLVTMVAVDGRGRPLPVPGLLLETPEEKARWAAARARRERRARR